MAYLSLHVCSVCREDPVQINKSSDHGDGENDNPDNLIEDQILQDFFDESDKFNVTDNGESQSEVRFDGNSSL